MTRGTAKAAMAQRCAFLVIASLMAGPAYAQGRGNENGQSQGNGKSHSQAAREVTADPATSSPSTPQSRAAYLGSWLDDASVVGPGAVWGVVSFVGAQGGQFYFPVLDVAMGASTRTQVGVSVPVSRVDDGSGSTSASVNQAFFYGKWRVRDASKSDGRLGVALTPVIEISRSQVGGSQDISLGVPVNFEVRQGAVRAYGSAGFFTRGALFQSAALEIAISSAVSITGTIGHTYSTSDDAQNDPAGRHRTDLGIGTMVSLNRSLAVFGAMGRSMTSSAGATWAAAGLSVFTAGR